LAGTDSITPYSQSEFECPKVTNRGHAARQEVTISREMPAPGDTLQLRPIGIATQCVGT